MSVVLQVQNLSFSYPQRHVITQWSACLGPGLTWLRGANGCGKSTLLQLLAGALPPLTGSVRLSGTLGKPGPGELDLLKNRLSYQQHVFWCGPGAPAFEHLHAEEFFGFMHSLYPSFDATALAKHVQGFALAPHAGQRLSALSTGTQRKVWLAAALASGCTVRLLDEPLNALDAASLAHLHTALADAAASTSQVWLVASHEAPGPNPTHVLTLN
jgi:ABC-type multidrug transport system ATPase subunit